MRIKIDQDGEKLDEIFAKNVKSVHLERLDDNIFWLRISGENKDVIVTFNAYKNKLQTNIEIEE